MSATTAPAWTPRGATPLGSWPPHAPVDPFWPALLLALILHGLLIYALGFQAPEPSRAPGRTLEVLVLRQPEAVRPPRPDAEALAQGSQEASGTASEIAAMDRRPSERRAEPIDSPATAIESEQAPPPV
ncbi:MAG: hypothetical protein WBJ41_10855, partial [Chromatiaceae bacterium]